MALITGAPRSADVVADEWSALMELDNTALARLAGERPDIAMALLRNLSAVLADRLRDTTVQLSETGGLGFRRRAGQARRSNWSRR